jgi:hypothetical protein
MAQVKSFRFRVTTSPPSKYKKQELVVGFLQVFMLSAVSPAKMAEVIINLKQVLKVGYYVLATTSLSVIINKGLPN